MITVIKLECLVTPPVQTSCAFYTLSPCHPSLSLFLSLLPSLSLFLPPLPSFTSSHPNVFSFCPFSLSLSLSLCLSLSVSLSLQKHSRAQACLNQNSPAAL